MLLTANHEALGVRVFGEIARKAASPWRQSQFTGLGLRVALAEAEIEYHDLVLSLLC